jgi:hypothetical protein
VKDDGDVLLMAQSMSALRSDTIWCLDTGANNHMTGHKHLFAEMTELEGSVSFGDASKVEVKGKGNVKFFPKEWEIQDD